MGSLQDQFLSQVKSSYTSKNSLQFADLFDPLQSSSSYYQLHQSLNSIPSLRPSSFQSLTRSIFPTIDERPLADLCASYLLFVRDSSPRSTGNKEEAKRNFELLEECFKSIDRIFSSQDAAWFVPTLRKFTSALTQSGLHAGRVSQDPKLPQASTASRIFRRPITLAAADKSETPPSKRLSLLHLANSTFSIYFALHNLRLCDTVLSSVSSILPYIDNNNPKKGLVWGKADRVTFGYYRGRLGLYQRKLGYAREELGKSFEGCWSHEGGYGNGRLILIYLIAASLPLGILPTSELLEQFDLVDQYGMLVYSLQLGDYKSVLEALEENEDWFRRMGNYSLLKEKLWTVCWRNLFRRTLFILHNGKPSFPSGPPTLDLEAVLITSRISFGTPLEPELDIDDIESIACSLIDQGYIKGYVNSMRKIVVLQRGERMGFPRVCEVAG